jgi:hypothetical protein
MSSSDLRFYGFISGCLPHDPAHDLEDVRDNVKAVVVGIRAVAFGPCCP